MQGISAGLRDYADLRTGAFAVFGGIGVGEDIEFADRVDAQQFSADAAGGDAELAGAGVFDAVEEDDVIGGAASGHRERVAVTGAGVGGFEVVADGAVG